MLIDLKKLWEVTVVVSTEAEELSEKDIYLDYNTQYDYETFLGWYSIKIDLDRKTVTYYNNDRVPYEDFTYQEYYTLPLELLEMTEKEIIKWVHKKGDEYLEKQLLNDKYELERMKRNVEILTEKIKELEENGKNKL